MTGLRRQARPPASVHEVEPEVFLEDALFNDPAALGRTVLVGLLSYAGLVVLLRISGKRTLSKMNAFDFVVTVALGSTLATILLNRDVSLAQGLTALALLIGLQYLVTWASVRAAWVKRVVTGEPALLLRRGEFLREAMRHVRVTEEEIRAAVRGAGLGSTGEAEAVVLETDGSLTVIRSGEAVTGESSSLAGVRRR